MRFNYSSKREGDVSKMGAERVIILKRGVQIDRGNGSIYSPF